MSKLVGRQPVEIKLADLKQGYAPVYDTSSRSWKTINLEGVASETASYAITASYALSGPGSSGTSTVVTASAILFTSSLDTNISLRVSSSGDVIFYGKNGGDLFIISDSGSYISPLVVEDDNGQPLFEVYTNGNATIAGSVVASNDSTINGVSIGRGGGSISTNTRIGASALSNNTTGNYHTAIGYQSLVNNTTGFENTAIGFRSLYSNTAGTRNIGVGAYTLHDNSVGGYNVAVGFSSLYFNISGSFNTAVGFQSLVNNVNGSRNTAIGNQSLYTNDSGSYNTAIGFYALVDNRSGSNNTAIGYNTGLGITTGDYNTIIGANVTGLSSTLSNNIIIADGQGNRRINIDSSGNTGLGKTSPINATLDVFGDTIISGSLNISGSLTVTGASIPQNSQSAEYTLVESDANKHIYHPSEDTTARIWTIPANSSVPYDIGTSITFVNDTGGGTITISITTDALVLAGSGTTGSRTLAANGVATAIKVTSTRWIISGTGLT